MRKISVLLLLMLTVCANAEVSNPGNFSISVANITATCADITYTPNNDDAQYVYGILKKSVFDNATETSMANANKESMDSYIETYSAYGVSYTYSDFGTAGEYLYSCTGLEPNTEYVALAYYLNTQTGLAASGFDAVSFKTAEAVMSDNQITMSYVDGKIKITTTNNDPYYVMFESKDDYQYYSGLDNVTTDGAAAMIEDWVEITDYYDVTDNFIFRGDQLFDPAEFWAKVRTSDLEDGDYVAYAGGWDGYLTTEAKFLEFHYTEPEIAQTDEKSVYMPNVSYLDYIDSQNWWQIMAYSEDNTMFVSLSPSECDSWEGTYDKADMDGSYTYIEFNDESQYSFKTLSVVVTRKDDVISIKADGLAKNGVLYHLTFPDSTEWSDYDGINEVTATGKSAPSVRKFLQKGKILLQKDGHTYNTAGQRLK